MYCNCSIPSRGLYFLNMVHLVLIIHYMNDIILDTWTHMEVLNVSRNQLTSLPVSRIRRLIVVQILISFHSLTSYSKVVCML